MIGLRYSCYNAQQGFACSQQLFVAELPTHKGGAVALVESESGFGDSSGILVLLDCTSNRVNGLTGQLLTSQDVS